MNLARFFLVVIVLAGLALQTGCRETGVVVQLDEGRLTLADRHGQDTKTYEVASDAKVTLDGRAATLEDLDPGDSVSVAIKQVGEEKIATKVNARSQEKVEAEKSHPPIAPPMGPGL